MSQLSELLDRISVTMAQERDTKDVAFLELHSDRIDDLMRASTTVDAHIPAWAQIAGIGLLSRSYLPKGSGYALDRNRRCVGVVICSTPDVSTWVIVYGPSALVSPFDVAVKEGVDVGLRFVRDLPKVSIVEGAN